MPKDMPAAEQPKSAELRPAAEVRKTPEQWAKELGHMKPRKLAIALNGSDPGKRPTSEHRRAATAHRWDANDKLGHPAFHLSETDYRKAIEAATVGAQHEPAIAPFARAK